MPARLDLAGPAAIAPGLDLGDTWGLGSLFLGLAVLIAIVALTHQRSRAFSPSVVYLGLGAAGAAGAALLDLSWLDLVDDAETVERLAELAVIVALFATGMRLDRPIGLRGWRSTILLLGVVMPITIAAVAAFGALAMGLSAGAAIVLGAALAPTDPVLAGDLGVGPPGERDERVHELRPDVGGRPQRRPRVPVPVPRPRRGRRARRRLPGRMARGGRRSTRSRAASSSGRPAAGRSRRWRPACASGAWSPPSSTAGRRSAPCWPSTGSPRSPGPTASSPPSPAASPSAGASATTSTTSGVHAGAETLERVLELAMILLLGSLVTLDGPRRPRPRGVGAGGGPAARRPAARLPGWRCGRPGCDAPERLWVGWFGVRGVGSLYYAAAALGSGVLAAREGGDRHVDRGRGGRRLDRRPRRHGHAAHAAAGASGGRGRRPRAGRLDAQMDPGRVHLQTAQRPSAGHVRGKVNTTEPSG